MNSQNLKKHINIKTSIDLFAGAGGISEGFRQAQIKSLLALDIDKAACITFKINNPEAKVLNLDITTDETKETIMNLLKGKEVDLICGGPPCQGFSHAGKRFIDDPRNKLFKDYVKILTLIKPKIFVFENVEGIKSMQKGMVFKDITDSFSENGYNITHQTLIASEFGVPQKRKRVFIIGVRNDIDINLNNLFPQPINEVVTISDAIKDLESVSCDENATYSDVKTSSYVKELKLDLL